MLIQCPECELQVSDKAMSCPHCGYPMRTDVKKRKPRNKNNKRRRLPNGFGQISEIKNRNLRKPFRAMVTVGKNSNGRPICKPLKPESYFSTYNDAYTALVEYNKNPYDLDVVMTVKELYEKWTENHFKTLTSDSSIRSITSAWAYCSSIYNMRVKDVRARHIKCCIEEGIVIVKGQERVPSANIKVKMKSMFNLMLDYAVEYEIADKNYARTFNLSDDILHKTETKSCHIPFTDSEIELLWRNINEYEYIDIMLIQCYSGWRPQELGLIELDNVDLENFTFKGGMKTDSGKNRIVPIHSKIRNLVKNRYEQAVALGSRYLLNYTDKNTHRGNYMLTYARYKQKFTDIINALHLNPEHRPHDGRKHFVTMAKKYNVDEYAIKYIVGHLIQDITERVYTQRETEWLKNEIEKIK